MLPENLTNLNHCKNSGPQQFGEIRFGTAYFARGDEGSHRNFNNFSNCETYILTNLNNS